MMPVMYVKVDMNIYFLVIIINMADCVCQFLFGYAMSYMRAHTCHDATNVHHQAVTQDISDKQDTKNLYDTPIYKTRQRGASQ